MNWDVYFIKMAVHVAAKSQDPSSRYGAVVVRHETKNILSTGYNGIPRQMDYIEKYFSRPDKYNYFVHAEQNAIFNAAREGIRLDGCHIYVIHPPCVECCKAIVQVGIQAIVYKEGLPEGAHDELNLDNWRQKMAAAAEILRQTGVSIRSMREGT